MRQPDRRFRVLLTALLAAFALAAPSAAGAADPDRSRLDERLRELRRGLEAGQSKARQLDSNTERLRRAAERARRERIEAARRIRDLESRILDLEQEVAALDEAVAARAAGLARQETQFASVLAALQRLAQVPPESILVRPEPPSEMVRSAILLRAAVPEIESRAGRLREELIALNQTRDVLASRRSELEKSRMQLTAQRRRLDAELARTLARQRENVDALETEARRIERLASRARDLQALLQELPSRPAETAPAPDSAPEESLELALRTPGDAPVSPPPEPAAPAPPPAVGSPLPAAGRVTIRYGESAPTGLTQKGITITTPSRARVVSPGDGTIVFAGPFRGYGLLLIIAHAGGYHSLLAGMSRIDGILGQSLKAGEPVGIMGDSGDQQPLLYVEVRRKGQPVNPMPWLRKSKGKSSG